jgi:hypothetical protein
MGNFNSISFALRLLFIGMLFVSFIYSQLPIGIDDPQQQQTPSKLPKDDPNLKTTGTGETGLSGVISATNKICKDLMTILPPLSMLLVVLAAIFYAAGKLVPNPEFSGRASGMAAAAIAAAVICLVIVLIMPPLLSSLYTAQMGSSAANLCQ